MICHLKTVLTQERNRSNKDGSIATSIFTSIRTALLTENSGKYCDNTKNDWSNNRSHIEIVQSQVRIDGMNGNAQIMQCRKRNNCQKYKFAERFPLVCHAAAFLFHGDVKIDCKHEETRPGIPGIFKKRVK